MQAAGAGKAGFQRGIQQGEPIRQQLLGVIERQVLLIAFWRHADPSRKRALKMRRAHAHPACEIVERDLRPACVDQVQRAGDDAVMVGGAVRIGLHRVSPVGIKLGELWRLCDPEIALCRRAQCLSQREAAGIPGPWQSNSTTPRSARSSAGFRPQSRNRRESWSM
ncbi:hypothetical protein GALL_548110 [mine drainage metagenome]|uniref:Uncharacterized protein n=1 Tax=mine drainage metagenome TaxID=410659 RepID=A0A1J5NZG9_9ZZZZ